MKSCFLVIVLVGLAWPSWAVDYFVEKSGDDAHPGTRMQPFKTIGKAASVMEPGDSCIVSRGLYRETIRPAKSGKAGAPLVFLPAPGETVALTGVDEQPDGVPGKQVRDWGLDAGGLAHIELRGFNLMSCGINLSGARMCRVDDCHLWWSGARTGMTNVVAAILLGGKDNEVVNSSVIGNTGYGVVLLDGGLNNCLVNCLLRGKKEAGGAAVGILAQGIAPVIRNVSVMDYAGGAMVCSNVQNARIEANDLHHAGAGATNSSLIRLAGDGRGTVLAYNWIHDNAAVAGTGIRLEGPVENYVLRQNVVWGQSGAAILMTSPSRYNFVFNNTCALNGAGIETGPRGRGDDYGETRIINNIFAGPVWTEAGGVPPEKLVWKNNFTGPTPGFVDLASGNFNLAAGSPCIDAGQEEPEFTDEFTGKLPDMGAYEFGKDYPVPGCKVNESANKVVTPVVKFTAETETPGAVLRYTLDGRAPDLNSLVYTGAVPVGVGTRVRVRAFRAGMEESGTATVLLKQME
ncbi:MAG: chitobiase/beta-hexosaminidase C-terminal domain-containing protein [bacterium]